MRSASTGPLVIAGEVLAVVAEWHRYVEEADGMDPNSWLKAKLGAGMDLGYWRRRAEAVRLLGEGVRRTMHHEVAVWIAGGAVPDHRKKDAVSILNEERARRGDVVLTIGPAMLVVRRMLGREANKQACARCTLLTRLLERHGIAVPGEDEDACDDD
jgi:hypothetical protein